MTLRIGVSRTIFDALQKGELAEPGVIPDVDVTLMLESDDGRWVDNAYRRLRPLFVSSVEEAREVYQRLTREQGGSNE